MQSGSEVVSTLFSGGKPYNEAESFDLRSEAYTKQAGYWEVHKDHKDWKGHYEWSLKMAAFFKKKAQEIRSNELQQVS